MIPRAAGQLVRHWATHSRTLFQNEEKEQDKTRTQASFRWTSRCKADALPSFLAPSFSWKCGSALSFSLKRLRSWKCPLRGRASSSRGPQESRRRTGYYAETETEALWAGRAHRPCLQPPFFRGCRGLAPGGISLVWGEGSIRRLEAGCSLLNRRRRDKAEAELIITHVPTGNLPRGQGERWLWIFLLKHTISRRKCI